MVQPLLLILFMLCPSEVLAHPVTGHATAVAMDGNTPADDAKKRKKGIISKFADYLANSNKEKKNRNFDFSLIGGPHYSTDTKLGLGIVATGLYRTDRNDTLPPPSNISLYGDITTASYYKIGIRGTHVFPHDRCRIEYDVSFDSFKSKFWGIGYDMGNNDSNESDMNRCQVEIRVGVLWRMGGHVYAGPVIVYDFVRAGHVERPEFMRGMDRVTQNFGAGISVVYDSRDVTTNPHRGAYLNLSQLFRPRFTGSGYALTTTGVQAAIYRRVWRGGIIAGNMTGTFNFGDPPWGLMSKLGSSYSMRGYYEGRYRDKHKLEAQVELRQHVWRRNGITAWLGAGTVFDKFDSIRADRLLPNAGIGYRWEFKKDVNVRIDYGFGKSGQSGFIFQINEAF